MRIKASARSKAERRMLRRQKKYDRQGGECYWCFRKMDMMADKSSPLFPTLEHLDSKWSGNRGYHGAGRVVLACLSCNQIRGREEQAAYKAGIVSMWGVTLHRVMCGAKLLHEIGEVCISCGALRCNVPPRRCPPRRAHSWNVVPIYEGLRTTLDGTRTVEPKWHQRGTGN